MKKEEIDDTEEYKLLEIWYKLENEPEKLTEAEKKIVREYGVNI
jgi:hypothetical protein